MPVMITRPDSVTRLALVVFVALASMASVSHVGAAGGPSRDATILHQFELPNINGQFLLDL